MLFLPSLQAIAKAKAVTDKPSLIKVSTLIGYGSPNKADSHDVHGAPLGADETKATRENLGWEYGPFEVPEDVYDVFRSNVTKGQSAETEWKSALESYKAKYAAEYAEFTQLVRWVERVGLLKKEFGGGFRRVLNGWGLAEDDFGAMASQCGRNSGAAGEGP